MEGEVYVGQRRSYDDQLCTIRYVGPVSGTKGEWFGVEWDDPARGKHNGKHDSVKYFSCISRQPTPASFIRPTRRPDASRHFVEAVKHKYASDFGAHGVYDVHGYQQSDSNIRISGKDVEEVGFDKIRRQLANLRQLRIVLVDTLCINRPGARHKGKDATRNTDIAEACPNVTELDLSRNLFEEWAEVVDICQHLPRLTSLKAGGNRFAEVRLQVPDYELRTIAPFNNIKSMGLDDTLLPWEDVARICNILVVLTNLSACGNEYTSLPDIVLPSSLTSISLERNSFSSPDMIRSLGRLQDLQKLSLKSNALDAVYCTERDDDDHLSTLSISIRELDLAYNQIHDWNFMNQLAIAFPAMTSLRVSHNPLYEELKAPDGKSMTPEDGYMLTLARIGRLERLNYSAINAKERLNAEIYYLSQIRQETPHLPPAASPATVTVNHPRYAELIAKYQDMNTAVLLLATQTSENTSIPVNPKSLAANLITVNIKLGPSISASVSTTNDHWKRRVPRSCTIYTLQGLIGRHFDLPPLQLQLVLETGEEDDIHYPEKSGEPKMREEILIPRMRSLGTWADDSPSENGATGTREMTLRVEWDAVCVERAKKAVADAGSNPR